MKQVTIKVERRTKTGKETAKKARKAGYIPAILYGKGIEPIPFLVPYSEFEKYTTAIKVRLSYIPLNSQMERQ